MAIKFKFAKIADNISEEDFVCVDKEGKKKATVRPILLSNKTVGRDELAERISRKYPRFSSEAHTIIGVMLESIKDVLKDGEIVHIKGFRRVLFRSILKDSALSRSMHNSRNTRKVILTKRHGPIHWR